MDGRHINETVDNPAELDRGPDDMYPSATHEGLTTVALRAFVDLVFVLDDCVDSVVVGLSVVQDLGLRVPILGIGFSAPEATLVSFLAAPAKSRSHQSSGNGSVEVKSESASFMVSH